jgi:uncharacterized protein YeeX (DUF496 family)
MEGFNVRRSKGREVPATELSNEQLQKAYKNAQKKMLQHHKSMLKLDEVSEYLRDEAESRGIILKEIEEYTEVFPNLDER